MTANFSPTPPIPPPPTIYNKIQCQQIGKEKDEKEMNYTRNESEYNGNGNEALAHA